MIDKLQIIWSNSNFQVTFLLLLIGAVFRIEWMILTQSFFHYIPLGEASNVAVSFAKNGSLAYGFFVGAGPTAHLTPIMVMFAGGVYSLWGAESQAANVTLSIWAIFQVLTSFLLVRLLFSAMGHSSTVLTFKLAILCLVPAHISQEGANFRIWEGALAVIFATLNLILIVDLLKSRHYDFRKLLLGCGLSAITFLLARQQVLPFTFVGLGLR